MEVNKEKNTQPTPERLSIKSKSIWEPFFTKPFFTKSGDSKSRGIWIFTAKTGIVLIGIFALIVMITPDFSDLRSKLRQLDTAKSRLVWLSFIKNPQALLKISEIEEEEGKFDNAIRETELAIGLIEMHGADKQIIQKYSDRVKKLMTKKKAQEKKDFEILQKAAVQGRADAQYNLGVEYANGFRVLKDSTKAVGWYQKSAARGYAPGQNNLGLMYQNGEGISRDIVRAYAWFKLSAAQGYADAIKNRDQIEKKLNPAQRAEGQRLVSDWKIGDVL